MNNLIAENIIKHRKADFNLYDLKKVNEILKSFDETMLNLIILNIKLDTQNVLEKRYLNIKTLLFFIKQTLLDEASKFAKKAKFSDKKFDSRYEEERILRIYFFNKSTQNMPIWAKNILLGENDE